MKARIRILLTSIFFSLLCITLGYTQKTIQGFIYDVDTGEPLIGANIIITGTSIGASADFDGSWSLEVDESAESLTVSYTGYNTQVIPIGDQTNFDIQMKAGEILDEVVVIGYGTIERKDATGSIQAISSEDFNRGAVTGAGELLAGKVAGVVVSTEGAPGSGSTIRIRGESSLSASNDPLIVIDGVPLDGDDISGARNPLNIINPNDIETFTVLKDASAAAIYGNRAAGGVILITTKKGALGDKVNVGYTGQVSVGTASNKVDVLDADAFRQVLAEQFEADHPALALLGNANTDWQDEIYQTALGQDHNIYASGGIGFVPFRVSLGYSNKDGILKTDNFNRLTAGINLSPGLLDNTLQLNLHLKAMRTNNHFADRGAIGNALGFDPTQAVRDPSSPYGGFTTWTIPNGNPNTLAPTNPLALLELKDDESTVNRLITNFTADYRFKFFPKLRANLNLAYDRAKGSGTVVVPTIAAFAFDDLNGGGTNNEYEQVKENSLLEFYLNYKETFGKHGVDLMAGYSWQHFQIEDSFKNSDAAGTPSETTEGFDPSEYYLLSYFGRANYDYNDLVLLTFTLRRDGTSRFAPDNRWGLFPAAAVAVKVIDKEDGFLQNLKVRAGFGVTGQQDIGDFYAHLARYQAGFENARYQFGNTFVTTLRPNGYDANIQWEETTTYNVGLDFAVLNSRLTGTIDVYQRNTTDLLNRIPVPAGTNLTNFITTNIGEMENQGVEVSLNGTPILKEKASWDIGLNVAFNQSEITKLTAVDDPSYEGVLTGGIAGGVGSNIQIHSVGFAPSSFYVFEQLYDAQGNLIEGEFADLNGDGIESGLDKYRFEKPAPDVTIGITNGINVGDFSFSFAGRAYFGNYVYNNVQTDMGYLDRLYGTTDILWNVHQSAVDNNVQAQANLTFSDFFVRDGSFFRIDHITAGYQFYDLIGKSFGLTATIQNPFVITNYDGLDPEIFNDGSTFGIDNNVYPRPRTFVFGVNVEF